ncbi:hypothetical protein V1521DRAFT_427478 [Lipomyces starkeyi]
MNAAFTSGSQLDISDDNAVPARVHHHSAHKLTRTMSGFDLSTLPDAEQMKYLVATLRKSMRRSSEIRRSIVKENTEFEKLDDSVRNDPTEIRKYEERKKKLEIDLNRTEAFVRRYMTSLAQLSGIFTLLIWLEDDSFMATNIMQMCHVRTLISIWAPLPLLHQVNCLLLGHLQLTAPVPDKLYSNYNQIELGCLCKCIIHALYFTL